MEQSGASCSRVAQLHASNLQHTNTHIYEQEYMHAHDHTHATFASHAADANFTQVCFYHNIINIAHGNTLDL